MSQITHGMRAVFSHPRVYDGFQRVMGATRLRQELVRDFIRPQPGMRLLDIGCGTAEILRLLPRDVIYCGFDISPIYIEAARASFGPRGSFHCGSFDQHHAISLPKFDLVIALGVLHHLNDDEAREVFVLARTALNPSGRVLTIDPCFEPHQNPIARYLISRDRGQNVRMADGYQALPGLSFRTIDGQVRHRTWIPYTHWLMECKP